MKGFLRFLSIFLLIGAFASNAWANKPKILQLKDLQFGTNAIGFSVFRGVEPQRFDVVLGNTADNMGNSFIMVRIYGGPMETPLEKIGAISGMSGSPIFIGCSDLEDCTRNGTLVGALSYSIGSFIEGGMNALITPAEYMLGARTSGYAAMSYFSNGPPNKISIGGQDFYNLMLFPKMEDLQVAGNSNDRCKESVKSDIKPGSMVSVFLATGAVNIGGSGTVTWRDGNNIYIFGHPLMGSGMVSYPFVQVSVADTIQTPLNASKITGCYLDTKGAMLVDGAFEMAGMIGATASMLPYQVELHIGHGGSTLSEEIAASPIAPVVINTLPVLWAEQSLGDLSHISLAYQARITLKDQPEIFVRSFIPAQINKNPFADVFKNVYHPIQILKESGFFYSLEGIQVRLDVVKNFGLWSVKRSFLSEEKTNPGETVYINIILEEYFSSATKQMTIPIKVPEDFMERMESAGQPIITILVQSGNKFTDKIEPVQATSVEDLIKHLNQAMNYKTNVLYVQEVMPRTKAEHKANEAKAKASTKPAWKWTDVGETDLKQLPRNDKNEIVLTLSPTLNDFINLNLTFSLEVQPKTDVANKDKKQTEHRKWFLFFLF